MADVAFVFVREDAAEAEMLAEAFERSGYSIVVGDAGRRTLNVVLWSRTALRSPAFRASAERALNAPFVIVASLTAPPETARVLDARVVDLSTWDGEDGDGLEDLIEAADLIVRPALPRVIALPASAGADPLYEDAAFSEAESGEVLPGPDAERARQSWEAPISTQVLRQVASAPPAAPQHAKSGAAAPPQAKSGAVAPRRDFRRVGARPSSRAPAALAFIGIALIGIGVAFASLQPPAAPPPPPRAHVQVGDNGGVSLSTAAADTAGLSDLAPIEPAPQRGHAGLEPPTAPVRRVSYAGHGG